MIIFEDDTVLRILRSLGDIKLDEFPDRLRLQKQAYLIQNLGAGREYSFSWYLYGPYSSSLTSTLFSGDELDMFQTKPKLTNDEKTITNRLKSLLGKDISNPSVLELFASIWYLLPDRKLAVGDKDSIVQIICKEKPYFSPSEIVNALDRIISLKKAIS